MVKIKRFDGFTNVRVKVGNRFVYVMRLPKQRFEGIDLVLRHLSFFVFI